MGGPAFRECGDHLTIKGKIEKNKTHHLNIRFASEYVNADLGKETK